VCHNDVTEFWAWLEQTQSSGFDTNDEPRNEGIELQHSKESNCPTPALFYPQATIMGTRLSRAAAPPAIVPAPAQKPLLVLLCSVGALHGESAVPPPAEGCVLRLSTSTCCYQILLNDDTIRFWFACISMF
jgi:hypothetical protein